MRYYWLKLKSEFFRDLRVIKLRHAPNGAALTLLYLELLVASLPTDGALPLLGMDAPETELSWLLRAPEADCAALLSFLSAHGLLERTAENGLRLTGLGDYVGAETASAADKRRQRAQAARREEAEDAYIFLPESCPDNVGQRPDNVRNCPGETEKETEKETETEKDSDPHTDTDSEKEPAREAPAPSGDPAAFGLPTKEKQEYVLEAERIKEYAGLFPELDIRAELRAMRSWLLANPDRRKSPAETPRFVNGWLLRAKEKAGAAPARRTGAPIPAQRAPAPGYGGTGYSGGGYASPPSYDLQAAEERMKTSVPKLVMREKR